MAKKQKQEDKDLEAVAKLLSEYKKDHAQAQTDLYRYSSASTRLRIIDPDLEDLDLVQRDDLIHKYLKKLPKTVFWQVTMALMLTPEEAKDHMVNWEFEDPAPSRL